MTNILDTITTEQSAPAVELPRLTVADTFKHYARMGVCFERALTAYKAMPEATPQGCTDELKAIMAECETISKTAARLLEANK